MKSSRHLILALSLALAPGALAQTPAPAPAPAPASRDPAQVRPGRYVVDPDHTQVGWRVSHLGFSNYAGGFSGVSGTLELEPGDPAAARLAIRIPVASVATTSPKLTDELKGEQWLDAGRYPEMTFVSTRVAPVGPDRAQVTGDLTLHGVTKPVTLEVALVGSGVNPIDKRVTVGFEVTGTIRRSEFGVTTYVPLVGDELHLTIAGAFERGD